MSIKYKCPKCRAKLENPDSMGDLQDTCPACRTVHAVPRSKKQKKERRKGQARKKIGSDTINRKSHNPFAPQNNTAVDTDFDIPSHLINDNNLSMECGCGAEIKVNKRFAGKQGKCPQCGKMVRIPNPWAPLSRASNDSVSNSPDNISNTNAVQDGMEGSSAPQIASSDMSEQIEVAENSSKVPLQSQTDQGSGVSALDKTGISKKPTKRLDYWTIIAGSLMLLTFFLPWGFSKNFFTDNVKVIMSWNVIGDNYTPGMIIFFMISAWLIGLAVILVASLTRGLALFITKCATGCIWWLTL